MIKAIISDLGNVLVKCDLEKLDSAFNEMIDFTKIFRYNSSFSTILSKDIYSSFERGKIKPLEFYEYCREEYALNCDFDKFKEAFYSLLVMDDVSKENFGLMVDVKRKGEKKVVLLTNTNQMHFEEFLKKNKEFSEIEYVTSYETGFRKPEAEIYRIAVARAGCEISDCLFVDDREEFISKFISMGGKGLLHIPGTKLSLERFL